MVTRSDRSDGPDRAVRPERPPPGDPHGIVELASGVVAIEAECLAALAQTIDESFAAAVAVLSATAGRIAVVGIGKSGHVAAKVAATLSSTGSPAVFVHAAEAAHGDLGMITPDDSVVAISHSGATPEVLRLLPRLHDIGVPLVAVVGQPGSPLARQADVVLVTGVRHEADHLRLAPTCSTTAALVLGDALAVVLARRGALTAAEFGAVHPGGTLGERAAALAGRAEGPTPGRTSTLTAEAGGRG